MEDDSRKACLDRQEAEISLLQAMYPEQVEWNSHRRELCYREDAGAALVLRLPDNYPENAGPMLVSALDRERNDFRDLVKEMIAAPNLPLGEEVLDTIIQAFESLSESTSQTNIDRQSTSNEPNLEVAVDKNPFKTVVIWLHHLLNTNKRKLALTPSMGSSGIVGVTKPGYPGILVYSGEKFAVEEHVAELKAQRWQAFQIRLEQFCAEPWKFVHVSGIHEVKTMSEITEAITDETHREAFLKAVHIK